MTKPCCYCCYHSLSLFFLFALSQIWVVVPLFIFYNFANFNWQLSTYDSIFYLNRQKRPTNNPLVDEFCWAGVFSVHDDICVVIVMPWLNARALKKGVHNKIRLIIAISVVIGCGIIIMTIAVPGYNLCPFSPLFLSLSCFIRFFFCSMS